MDLNISMQLPIISKAEIPLISHYLQEFEKTIAEKESEGITVIRSDPRHLLIDLDDYDSVLIFQDMYKKVCVIYPCASCEYWFSKGGNHHVYVTLSIDLPVEERIALQCSLGSDRLREFLSLWRLRYLLISEPSLLFRPVGFFPIKYKAGDNLLLSLKEIS